MPWKSRVSVALIGWVVTVSVLHVWLNLGGFDATKRGAHHGPPFRVGYLPVT